MNGASALHELKSWPEYFEAVVAGRKPFEIRKNDRDFKVGDILRLAEFDPTDRLYTGRLFNVEVTYMVSGEWGLPADLCVMGIVRRSGVPYFSGEKLDRARAPIATEKSGVVELSGDLRPEELFVLSEALRPSPVPALFVPDTIDYGTDQGITPPCDPSPSYESSSPACDTSSSDGGFSGGGGDSGGGGSSDSW